MIDVSLVNSCILYNRDKDRSSRVPLLEFRIAVATGLLDEHQYRTDRRHHAYMKRDQFQKKYLQNQSLVADTYVKSANQRGLEHLDVKHAKLHCIVIHTWSYITQILYEIKKLLQK